MPRPLNEPGGGQPAHRPLSTPPGKTTQDMTESECQDYLRAEDTLDKLWNAAHSIAPGRELELAEALPQIVEIARIAAAGIGVDLDAVNTILTKLGLNGGSDAA